MNTITTSRIISIYRAKQGPSDSGWAFRIVASGLINGTAADVVNAICDSTKTARRELDLSDLRAALAFRPGDQVEIYGPGLPGDISGLLTNDFLFLSKDTNPAPTQEEMGRRPSRFRLRDAIAESKSRIKREQEEAAEALLKQERIRNDALDIIVGELQSVGIDCTVSKGHQTIVDFLVYKLVFELTNVWLWRAKTQLKYVYELDDIDTFFRALGQVIAEETPYWAPTEGAVTDCSTNNLESGLPDHWNERMREIGAAVVPTAALLGEPGIAAGGVVKLREYDRKAESARDLPDTVCQSCLRDVATDKVRVSGVEINVCGCCHDRMDNEDQLDDPTTPSDLPGRTDEPEPELDLPDRWNERMRELGVDMASTVELLDVDPHD